MISVSLGKGDEASSERDFPPRNCPKLQNGIQLNGMPRYIAYARGHNVSSFSHLILFY